MTKVIFLQGNTSGISSQLLIKNLQRSLLIIPSRKETSKKVTQESKIEISEEIMNQINKKHFYSKQKGRALSMLVTSREVYKVNRKRKREYAPYEVSKEEVKEYQKKRSKPMNYDRHNEREENWNEDDQEEFEKEMERIEDVMNSKDNNSMNVDR